MQIYVFVVVIKCQYGQYHSMPIYAIMLIAVMSVNSAKKTALYNLKHYKIYEFANCSKEYEMMP